MLNSPTAYFNTWLQDTYVHIQKCCTSLSSLELASTMVYIWCPKHCHLHLAIRSGCLHVEHRRPMIASMLCCLQSTLLFMFNVRGTRQSSVHVNYFGDSSQKPLHVGPTCRASAGHVSDGRRRRVSAAARVSPGT